MAEKCRSLNFFLLICALASGLLFYGCGGSTSSDPLPERRLEITGSIISPVQLANMVDSNGLLPDIRASFTAANIEVYLESNRAQFSTRTDSEGKYILSGVPAGKHRIIALFKTLDNKVFKLRSPEVSISEQERVTQVAALPLLPATSTAMGKIIDANGNPVANARLMLWGEYFYTDSAGNFDSPLMPVSNTPQNIITDIPGFQTTNITVTFTENTPFVEQTVVSPSATNSPPVSTLTANRYAVTANGQISFTATASDPDNDVLSYGWSATTGTFAYSADSLRRIWTAPNSSAVATITFVATDTAGLRSANSIMVKVGSGQIIANADPVVLEYNANATTFLANTDYQLSVVATDSDNDVLYYNWIASQGTIVTANTASTITWKAPSVVSLTNVQVTVKVEDRKGGVVYGTRTFPVSNDPNQPANRVPVVDITMPASGSLHLPGLISYTGQATDPEDGALAGARMRWFQASGGDGAILVADQRDNFTKNIYAPGTYTLTLQARDSLDTIGSQTIQFRINATPTISINSPSTVNHGIGVNLTFSATANDVEDGILAANRYFWTFPAPVGAKNGNNLIINNLAMGDNTITVSARDSMGANSATATLNVRIINAGPNMTISSPAANAMAFFPNQSITFTGSGADYNNQPIPAASMTWAYRHTTDTATTTLATGVATTVASFTKLGLHTITLTGVDPANKSNLTSRTFYINATPTVNITSPASGTRFDTGKLTVFAATVSDPDPYDSLKIRWYRDAGASRQQIGTGSPYLSQTTDLPAGSREITCEVVDDFGITAESKINLLINTLPVGTFTYSTTQYATAPSNLPVFISDNAEMNVTLTMNTLDAEDGVLPGTPADNNIQWFTPDNMVPFAFGKTVTQNFPLGAATVTVRIYDSNADQFIDQASATYSMGFHVWQKRSFAIADAVYIHGAGNKIYITGNGTTKKGVQEYDFIAGLSPVLDPFMFHDMVATAGFAIASAGVIYDGYVAALGVATGDAKICSFKEAATPTAVLAYSGMTGATSIAFHPQPDITYGYLSLGTSLTTFNPMTETKENDITTVEGIPFATQGRVRYVHGSPGYQGKVFATDTTNNRVIRFLDASCSNPRTIVASTPIDMAFTSSYVMTLSSTSRKVSLHSVTANGSEWLMDFGGAGPGAGTFTSPTGMYSTGKDLFILEGTNTITLIRSGETDWLK